MIRETFRRVAKFFSRGTAAPPLGQTSMTQSTAPTTRVRGNKYVPIPGHGPDAAARRKRAMERRAAL